MYKRTIRNMKMSLHGVIRVTVTDIQNDLKGSSTIWRDIIIENDDGEIFEITMFPRDDDKGKLNVTYGPPE